MFACSRTLLLSSFAPSQFASGGFFSLLRARSWRKCAIYMICKTSKRARKSTSASVDRPKRRKTIVYEREKSRQQQQCNVWCIAFMDHVKVGRWKLYASSSVRTLALAYNTKVETCVSAVFPNSDPTRSCIERNDMLDIFTLFDLALCPQKRAFSFSSTSIIPFSMIF